MSEETGNFSGYLQAKNIFQALPDSGRQVEELPAGSYQANFDPMSGIISFKKIDTNYDEIVDLPSPEYTQVMGEIEQFMNPDTKQKFADYGFIYKRSCLLQGPPGTGKTVIINRISERVIEQGGIVLVSPNAKMTPMFLDVLKSTNGDKLVLCIFEEFDQYFWNGECEDESILSLLDGETQKDNMMFLATTNYGEQISARFKRPGRFSTVIDMTYPNFEARHKFLEHKLGVNDPEIKGWAEQTDGLSIDELKETVLAVKCLNQSLDNVIQRIKVTKANVGKS